METSYIKRLVDHLQSRGVRFSAGLGEREIQRIEHTYAFRFPPDLRQILAHALPVSEGFPDWRSGAESELRQHLSQPLDGILFDVENNGFWLDEWGPRPTDLGQALSLAAARCAVAPTLVPLYRHRYLPSEPLLEHNPVLSVYQTDVIPYGNDLASYFSTEFGMYLPSWAAARPRSIRFWDQLAVLNR